MLLNVLKSGVKRFDINILCYILGDVEVESSINGLYFDKDVMRKDVYKNIFTAPTTISDLTTKELIVATGVKIQGVNVLDWFENAVYKDQPNEITGLMTFNHVEFQCDITLEGVMNGYLITPETVLTSGGTQDITGQWTFVDSNEPLVFENLKLNGLFNDMNFTEFIENQVS